MIEIVWRYDPDGPPPPAAPLTADEARRALLAGNQSFAALFEPSADGARRQVLPLTAAEIGLDPGHRPVPQQPFAAVLGCADARVPPELVLGQRANDLFVVRVAGNVLSAECLGSLELAAQALPSIKALVVLGHTACGAVTLAVDGFLSQGRYLATAASLPLRGIIDSLMAEVHNAADALEAAHGAQVRAQPGYRTALVDLAVVLNAAVSATLARQGFRERLGADFEVLYGVYHLGGHQVGLPGGGSGDDGWVPGLLRPPEHPAAFTDLALGLAHSPFIRRRLVGDGG